MNRRLQATTASLLLVALQAAAARAADWEKPEPVRAADVLGERLLTSPNHTIADEVLNDGFQYRYTVETKWGEFDVWGNSLLAIRVQEVEALKLLEEKGGAGDAIAEGLGSLGNRVVGVAGKVVDDPNKFFGGLFGAVKKRFGRTVDKAGRTVRSAEKVAEGGGEEAKKEVTKDVKKDIGMESAARRLHQRLGTDPYSRNEALTKGVRAAAKSQALARVVFDPISISDAEASAMGDALVTLYKAPPAKMHERNRGLLLATGATEAEVDTFLDHPEFSITLQTIAATDLGRMKGVADLDVLLEEGDPVSSEGEALFVIQSVAMMADYHARETPLARVIFDPAIFAAVTSAGQVAVFAAVDHITWSEELSADLGRVARANQGTALGLWITGTASPRCKDELAKLGFELHERAELGAF